MNSDPESIRLDPEKSLLEIRFKDGTVHRYEGAWLRLHCPCAQCRGHAPGEVEAPKWDDVKDVRLRGAVGVGSYAIRFDFTDGHDSGIYSFEWLRKHDPDAPDAPDAPVAGEA